MWLRRAGFHWLLPSAFLLPLWLFVGWTVTGAGGWALLWVLFIAIPSVFFGQLLLTLLTRLRPTARAERALSWWDVAGYGLWHALTIALGLFVQQWWAPVMVLTVLVGIANIWLQLWQLWREARPRAAVLHTSDGTAYIPPTKPAPAASARAHEVIVVEETLHRDA